jgi:hypothetical protein
MSMITKWLNTSILESEQAIGDDCKVLLPQAVEIATKGAHSGVGAVKLNDVLYDSPIQLKRLEGSILTDRIWY